VIFVGDNGTGSDGKGQTIEKGARVPFIVNGPGIVKPIGESRELVDVSDIVPTICEVAGITLRKEHEIDGVSFAPYLRGETGPLREWIYSYLGTQRVVRTKRWLLENNSMTEFGQLYDCGDSRNGEGYKDVTKSDDPDAVAARKLMEQILADKPVPVVNAKQETKAKRKAKTK
jgi:arylsulfatase A